MLIILYLTDETSLLEVIDTIAELKDQWEALGMALKLVMKEVYTYNYITMFH